MNYFCLFIGPGRSGHSLISVILNAHPNIRISNELGIFKKNGCYNKNKETIINNILKKCEKEKNKLVRGKYKYKIEKTWEDGDLLVIGDKHGNNTSLNLSRNFNKLKIFQKNINLPIKYIHSVRNPFDQITTESIRKDKSIDNLIEVYCSIMDVVQKIKNKEKNEHNNILEIYHEDLIYNKKRNIIKMCKFLGVDVFDDYIESCSKVIRNKPHFSRFRLKWTDDQKNKVYKKIINKYDILKGYKFDEEI